MLAEVRKCAETNDIKGLRYIFVDCLDVDPTFEKYEEDYNYCKDIPGLFDVHSDLNGMISDSRRWNASYWDQLKLDLMKNFSKERFEHMIQVAKVVYASKIERLISERQAVKNAQDQSAKTSALSFQEVTTIKETVGENASTIGISEPKRISDAELQERRLAEKRRELEEENRRIEAEQAAQRARIESAQRDVVNKSNIQAGNSESKKVLGMVLGIVIIVVVAFIIIKAIQ